MRKQKVLVILGQTATGKSDLAVKIAKKWGGEVVSADSRQVYKGLNWGTGKITEREMRGVRHHLLNIASPKKYFSVAQYQKLANRSIQDILKRGKIPIVCGGTGLYIDAVVNGKIFPEVKPNEKLRKRLNNKSVKQLFGILKKLDPRRAKEIDRNNPRRLIRAIEIATSIGSSPNLEISPPSWEILKIGLKLPDDKLKQKINARLITRIRKGMVAEATLLHERGLSWKRMNGLGLEYRYLAKYLNNKISKQEMINYLEIAIWRYSKRQMTWFKRDKEIIWLNPEDKWFWRKIDQITNSFLTN